MALFTHEELENIDSTIPGSRRRDTEEVRTLEVAQNLIAALKAQIREHEETIESLQKENQFLKNEVDSFTNLKENVNLLLNIIDRISNGADANEKAIELYNTILAKILDNK